MKSVVFLSSVLFFFLLINIFNFETKFQQTNTSEPAHLLEPKTPTLAEIFDKNYNPGDALPKDKTVTLLATGDVMLGRSVNIKTKRAADFSYPYKHSQDELKTADIALINLEVPLVENCPIINSGFTFCADVKHIDGLAAAGIDVVNTANNHILNFGYTGLETTNRVVAKHGLTLSNAAGPNYLNVKGTNFAFLGYNDLDYPTSLNLEKEKQLIKVQIAQAKQNADIVVVSMHWGNEYQSRPSARQRDLAHFIVDSGADLVVGNHPHWVQPVEVYHGKIIAYSHGNFIFDQTWSEKTKEGVVGKYTFFENRIVDIDFLPIYIEEIGQPKFIKDARGEKILFEMLKESLLLINN